SGGAVPESALHYVRDQRLNRDHFAALGLRRDINQGSGHQESSRHAPSVISTSTRCDHSDPSESSAIATTVCVSASRIRVDTLARPARGPSCTLITLGCGFFSVNTWMALT